MSATISTQQHHRVPLATALAIAGVLVAGGALGVAWEQSHDSTSPAQTPARTAPTAQDYSKYDYYHGPNTAVQPRVSKGQTNEVPNTAVAEQHLSLPQAPTSQVPNSAVADRQLSAPKAPSVAPNAQVAEQQLESTFQPPSGGRVQLGQ